MMTPTHIVTAYAVLSRKDKPRINLAIGLGAIVPDLSIYVLFVWGRFIEGLSQHQIWREVYWSEPWQTLSALSNSFPLFIAVALATRFAGQPWLLAFAAAALIHVALDFPFHALDAHRHFWPLSDWRFQSPLSYWDSRFLAQFVRPFEFCLALVCLVVLWRRFEALWVRGALLAAMASYVAVPVYFSMTLA